MHTDIYGQQIFSESDLCEVYLADTSKVLKQVLTETNIEISDILELENIPKTTLYIDPKVPVNIFDQNLQNNWFIPKEYKDMDIAKYVLELCQTDEELQRVGQELLLFQERDLFDLLKYLKYLVDTMRDNNIVWGVGRGSSVSSYILFLLGIHRINSLYYDLSIDEFLK
jgi:DNA polymerase III alpha subunit